MDYKYKMCLDLGLCIFVKGFGTACKRRGLISERAHEKRFEARDSSADQIAFWNPFYNFGDELISGGTYNGIYLFVDIWMGPTNSLVPRVGERTWERGCRPTTAGGGGREGYKIQFKVFRYFAPCWSRHGLKLLVFSSFRSTLAPVFGQSSLEIVGWPKSLSFFFTKDCLML